MSAIAELPLHVVQQAERAKQLKRRGHAAQPGTGPAGETCKTCHHLARNVMYSGKAFSKCELEKARWTGGTGTDIRQRDPACLKWMAKGAAG